MKLGIFSDTHLGFGEKGERFPESFENLEQALALCIEEQVDAAILAGDVFDAPVPSHSVLFKAMQSFAKAGNVKSAVKVFLEKNSERKEIFPECLPIAVVHGNHEFRGGDSKTALDVLNLAGLLVYFHAARLELSKGAEKVFIHGLGAVPEKKALQVLQHWNPEPVKGPANILVLHQGFKEFMAVDDEMVATLSLEDIPKGFDLAVNGHLHWNSVQNLGETVFLLPGSTIATSIKKLESEKPKGVFFYDTQSKNLSFKALPRQRKMFYHKIVFHEASAEGVLKECSEIISKDLAVKQELKPLIRLNLKGTLKKGLSPGDVGLQEIFAAFSEKALLSISKNFSSASFRKKISELREIQKSKLSVAAMGFELLEKNLEETDLRENFSAKELFALLAEDDLDKAMDLVVRKD